MITNLFPPNEKHGLVSQLRRASISVCSNLAEGASRTSKKEQARFSSIAYGSLMEIVNQLIIAVDLGFFEEVKMLKMKGKLSLLSKQIINFRKSQLKSDQALD